MKNIKLPFLTVLFAIWGHSAVLADPNAFCRLEKERLAINEDKAFELIAEQTKVTQAQIDLLDSNASRYAINKIGEEIKVIKLNRYIVSKQSLDIVEDIFSHGLIDADKYKMCKKSWEILMEDARHNL